MRTTGFATRKASAASNGGAQPTSKKVVPSAAKARAAIVRVADAGGEGNVGEAEGKRAESAGGSEQVLGLVEFRGEARRGSDEGCLRVITAACFRSGRQDVAERVSQRSPATQGAREQKDDLST